MIFLLTDLRNDIFITLGFFHRYMSSSFAKIEIISQSRKDFDRNFEQAMTMTPMTPTSFISSSSRNRGYCITYYYIYYYIFI